MSYPTPEIASCAWGKTAPPPLEAMGRSTFFALAGLASILLGFVILFLSLRPKASPPRFLPEVLLAPPYAEGSLEAPLLLVGFLSPTCPACAHHRRTVSPFLEEEVERGRVRLVYRVVPLDEAGLLLCSGPDFKKALEVFYEAENPHALSRAGVALPLLEKALGGKRARTEGEALAARETALYQSAGATAAPSFLLRKGGRWQGFVGAKPLGFWEEALARP